MFDNETYSRRHHHRHRHHISGSVETFFSWLKSFRRVQTSYDRLAGINVLWFPAAWMHIILMRRSSG
ncbi:MAG TPA: hypothetical protein VNI77_09210 [Nitrososphaera sp.]|nr:hypothetical protein [Nitrososphaera sp.]